MKGWLSSPCLGPDLYAFDLIGLRQGEISWIGKTNMHSTYNTVEGGGIPTYLYYCIKSTIGQSTGNRTSVSEHTILED